ncbi:hypothetical protein [Mycobacterium sp. 852002-51163_SCH5372311]|uniref:hypothetical protein n=1 Tax=Mycobacterium sp. 852002-51163_SCH5372311 TaxID=1834097 RepID=UPI000A76AA79|nr:hypothetical protein [Mycobacterium sp. 852002-51163_SCH5372311]
MTSPMYRDVERGLRLALARRRGDDDVLPLLAAECETAEDVDRLILAQADALNHVLERGLEDPEKFLANWIANVRRLADDEENPPPCQSGDV